MSGKQRDWNIVLHVSIVVLAMWVLLGSSVVPPALAQSTGGYSLRFEGHGVDDIDRVKIPVQTDAGSLPTDIGAADFTIEFWLRGFQAENLGRTVTCGQNEDWIYGSIVFDRDRFSEGRKFGISVDGGGRVVFGVTNASRAARTLCGASNVLDGAWHHIAVQRRLSDGQLTLFVDGRLDATVLGPTGDLSYPDGASVTFQGPGYCQGPGGAWGGYCRNEPFIVLGAEKHDAGASEGNPANYPSFRGWLDELRLSARLRYADPFTPQTTAFSADASTVGLFHFDEGPEGACTGAVLDSAAAPGSPVNGMCYYGGAGASGPTYTMDTPLNGSGAPTAAPPTATFTPLPPTATNTAAPPTATFTPLPPTATNTAAPPTATFTPLPPTATNTPTTGWNFALNFDGVDDVVLARQVNHAGVLTVEFWVRPATSSMEAVVVSQATDNDGWSFELNAGRPSFWVNTSRGWQVVRHATRLVGGNWYHVAATYNNGPARVFVNGQAGTASTLQSGLTPAGELSFGGIPGYGRFVGALDDIRISQSVRYSVQFTPPATLPPADANTLGQWSLNEGGGQVVADGSVAGNSGQLGLTPTTDAADPTWVSGR
ncbi:MAG TPA: LamG domain-containing protein [Chloroflexi bacterium]|nr:LamG domain-containing protein [Chloroflexota bacterium]